MNWERTQVNYRIKLKSISRNVLKFNSLFTQHMNYQQLAVMMHLCYGYISKRAVIEIVHFTNFTMKTKYDAQINRDTTDNHIFYE